MSNDDLIRKVKANSPNISAEVLGAMANIDRGYFIPGMYSVAAYRDQAVPIGDLQTCSQPSVVALIAQNLNLQPGDKVLEIGTGSGYAAAITLKLIAPEGELVTIERIRKLCGFAQHNLKVYFQNELTSGKLKMMHDNGLHAPKLFQQETFDKIYFTAGVKNIKFFELEEFVNLLKPQGILVVPEENGSIYVYTKSQKEKPFQLEELKGFKFVELKSGKA